MNANKLKEMVLGQFESQAAFARKIGWSDAKVCATLNGRYIPDVNEAATICKALEMPRKIYEAIFLNEKSPNGDKN